jgi:hypothetical protein
MWNQTSGNAASNHRNRYSEIGGPDESSLSLGQIWDPVQFGVGFSVGLAIGALRRRVQKASSYIRAAIKPETK